MNLHRSDQRRSAVVLGLRHCVHYLGADDAALAFRVEAEDAENLPPL